MEELPEGQPVFDEVAVKVRRGRGTRLQAKGIETKVTPASLLRRPQRTCQTPTKATSPWTRDPRVERAAERVGLGVRWWSYH